MSDIETAARITAQRERLEKMRVTCQDIVDRNLKSGELDVDDIERVILVEQALATIHVAEFMRYRS